MTTSTSGTPKPRRETFTFWITRDSSFDTGEADPQVRVWLAKPDRVEIGRGAAWMAPAFDEDLYAKWSLEECRHHVRTIPDDDRQCIRVDGDRVKQPTDQVERSQQPAP